MCLLVQFQSAQAGIALATDVTVVDLLAPCKIVVKQRVQAIKASNVVKHRKNRTSRLIESDMRQFVLHVVMWGTFKRNKLII